MSEGPEIRIISLADVARCPKQSLLPAHYRKDGSCLCAVALKEAHAAEEAGEAEIHRYELERDSEEPPPGWEP